ncbi:dynamin family protein [Dermatobacter hominis]|uniref:dynamin family protein n=1 Tax=Dermatobacter hominis TaxID=2884263 RepID=UPI001D11CB76|nr:dynamin family protein [Dermatobacter hominis]UDY35001.1 dynamin family protein [Dermatobacter hominis]
MTTSASSVVAEGLASVRPALAPASVERLDQVCARAAEPPTVAVAGRVSAGKSTLVNAVVGRRVAPTDAGECTEIVARFRFGRAEHVVVHGRDGTTSVRRLDDDGRIPATLGMPVAEVDHIEVHLANRRLRAVEIVDTPGVSSASGAGDRTERYLGIDDVSTAAVGRADAVLYLLTHTGRTDEATDLASFGSASGGRSDGAIGVLGKADLVAGGDRAAAEDLAGRLADRLQGSVRTVLPLWTLVAEAVSCGRLSEDDARAVVAISAVDTTTRELLLADASLFVDLDAPVDRAARQRLQDVLGHTGAARAVGFAADGARGAAQLADALDAMSGRAELDRALVELTERADVLRAARMLASADAIAYGEPDAAPLRDVVEQLRVRPELHVLDETTALDDLRSGRARLQPEVVDRAVATLVEPASVPDIDAAIDQWREVEVLCGDPVGERVARTVGRTLMLRRRGVR